MTKTDIVLQSNRLVKQSRQLRRQRNHVVFALQQTMPDFEQVARQTRKNFGIDYLREKAFS